VSDQSVFITGADGYLGSRVARRYLDSTDLRVRLWVRAGDPAEFETKKAALIERLSPRADRVSYHWGDLLWEAPFPSLDLSGISHVVHCAAITRFNVDEHSARRINVEGTARVLEFADRCPDLRSVGLVSTVYSSGLKAGPIEEVRFDDTGFANHYEQSKWSAEELLFNRFDHLPWRVLRVATIVADDEDGRVSQYNAVHNTLKLFYYGLLSIVPGRPATPVYFVTGSSASEALFALVSGGESRSIYHVNHTRAESLTLQELIEVAFECFSEEKSFRTRRVLKPLFSDAESFDLLVEGARSFGGGVIGQALSSVAPFAKQLFIAKDIHNARLSSALGGFPAPDRRRILENTCRDLVCTGWGRQACSAAVSGTHFQGVRA
jgi:thioester reductase-like protein